MTQMRWMAPAIFALLLFLSISPAVCAQNESAPAAPAVVPVAPAATPAQFLPERLAGVPATGEALLLDRQSAGDLRIANPIVLEEYRIAAAASRAYGRLRVDLFQARDHEAAFGLFTYAKGRAQTRPTKPAIGFESATGENGLVFWKGNNVVRVWNPDKPADLNGAVRLAAEIEKLIPEADEALPKLLESLPREGRAPASERYFLGADSLNDYIAGAREMFMFPGSAEAVLAHYQPSSAAPSLRLLIVEYHTPHFAYDAMGRATEVYNALPQEAKDRMILKRVGNFIVQATPADGAALDTAFAESLINSIEYPYTVKWLQDPTKPTRDPFYYEKAAQMLISTFLIIGILAVIVAVGGGLFGTMIFLRRRKQVMDVFSDAGGMLRLQIDPFERTILGLPPKPDEE